MGVNVIGLKSHTGEVRDSENGKLACNRVVVEVLFGGEVTAEQNTSPKTPKDLRIWRRYLYIWRLSGTCLRIKAYHRPFRLSTTSSRLSLSGSGYFRFHLRCATAWPTTPVC